MIAEDDDDMRSLLVHALKQDGYDVRSAGDGASLIVQIAENVIGSDLGVDLIISDIRMPVVGGLAVVEALRRSGRTVPVILMTAFGDDATRCHAEELGALLFDKPFALVDLRAAVKTLVPIVS